MSLNLRIMTQADLDEVLAIEQSVQAYPWTRGNFSDALDSAYLCYVAQGYVDQITGEIAGYAVLMPSVEEAELLTIAVAAGHQRKGLGAAMLHDLLGKAAANNWQRVFLEVRASNSAAISLYRNTGFVEVGLRRAYYRDANGCEDAIVMACDVSNELTGEQHG